MRPERQASCWCSTRAAIRGSGFFSGYYKDETATEQAWAGGWFHTGDLVRMGEDGRLFFVDRSKNVDSAQWREHCSHRSRKRAADSRRRTRFGRLSRAGRGAGRGSLRFRRAAPGDSRPCERPRGTFRGHCRQALAYYKAPGYIGFRSGLPQTASQKLARAQSKRAERAPSKAGKPLICGI